MTFPADDFFADKPRPSPLYIAAAEASLANIWTSVNGYTTARVYTDPKQEYDAVLGGVGLVDLSPLARYRITGSDAGRALNRLTTAPAGRIAIGETAGGVLCDNTGRVVDIAAIARLNDSEFLLTLRKPRERRLRAAFAGLDAHHAALTGATAALGVIGPQSGALLKAAGYGADAGAHAESRSIKGVRTIAQPTEISGMRAVELVFPADETLLVWERLSRAGRAAGEPRWIGLDALEALRIENGVPRLGLDFDGAEDVERPRAMTPVAAGLGRLAPLDSAWFSGRAALRDAPPPTRRLSALRVVAERVTPGARLYADGKEAGFVTSAAFSPRLQSVVAIFDTQVSVFDGAKSFSVANDSDAAALPAIEIASEDRPQIRRSERSRTTEEKLAAVGR